LTKKLLFAILLLSSCSFLTDTEIDSELQPYLNKYISYAKECRVPITDSGLTLSLDKTKSTTFGYCRTMFNTIKINKRSWVALTEIQKEQLIFHELTHCLLDQDHDDLGLNVMNTHGFIYKQLYVEYYDYFIRRLFLECRKPLYEKFKYEEI
jgi:hypothetical protein